MKHRFIKKAFLSLCFVQCYLYSHTQVAEPPKVIPPSPDAAAIQKNGNIPMSPYTGTPNISIPLYEIKVGDISVPISISYNASGIKVAEEASRVGLGWALNAGGVISRSVVGRDDWSDYHFQTSFDIPFGPKNYLNTGAGFRYLSPVILNGYTIPEDALSGNFLSDFQPDQYSYSVNGHSGKFILRRNKDVVLNKTEKVDIRLSDPVNATSWEIKTPDGFLYRFEDIENYTDGNSPFVHKSSWYLSKITSPTGRIVQFLYTPIALGIQTTGSYFESRPIGFIASICSAGLPPYISNTIPSKPFTSLYLSKIIFDLGYVEFNYGTGRVDVANDVQLNSMNVYAKNYGSTVNTLIKSWNFNYAYFTGTSINGWYNPSNPDMLYKRLKLLSIQESSPSESLPAYLFSYIGDDEVSTNLPAKLSFARDHWGYFNGKYDNTTLIPTCVGGGGGTINPGAMGSERNADAEKCKTFTLNQIKYPTGGYTKFEYESNDFDELKSIVNDHSYFASYTSAVPVQLQGTLSSTNISSGGTFNATLNIGNMYPFAQSVKLEAFFINYNGGLTLSQVGSINYRLYDPSNAQIGGGQLNSWLGSTSPPMTEWLNTQSNNTGVKMTLVKNLTPGTYTFQFDIPANTAYAANIVMSYTKGEGFDPINSSGDLVYNAKFGGGIRIKKITDYLEANSPVNIRRYKYHYQLNGKTYTYGRRMTKPNYAYYEFVMGAAGSGDCLGTCLVWESDSNIPLYSSTNGNPIGYDKVEELYGENGENGKIVYEYENEPNTILDYQDAGVPLKPPYGGMIANAGNGNLTRQSTYANVSGQFVRKEEILNTYTDLSNQSASLVFGIEKRRLSNTAIGVNLGIGYFIYPALTVNRPVLTASNTTQFDATGLTAQFTRSSEFTYDNSTHLQLTSKAEYKSNGDKLTTNFKYPADFADANSDAAIMQMKNALFMHALPIEQNITVTKNDVTFLLDAKINKYQFLNNKVLLKEAADLENNDPINISTPPTAYNPADGTYPSNYASRLFFDNYDATGNLTQIHKSDNLPVAYIWDYFSNYPVAEISNAEVSNCAFTGFEADGKGNWQFTGSAQNDLLSFTGKRVYALISGTITKSVPHSSKNYIVSYWSKTGPANVNGATSITGESRLGWTFYEHLLPAGTINITISGSATIDELRLFPKGSLMTTYTYIPMVGIQTQTDPNGKTIYYEYDNFNRLSNVKDHKGNIIKKYCYNYAGQSINCNGQTFTNTQAYSGQFQKIGCTTGFVGSTVTYTVPVGTVTSTENVDHANSLAQAKVNAEGQGYANANGTCIPSAQPGTCSLTVFSPVYFPTYSLYCNGTQTTGYIVVWFPNGITMGNSISIGAFGSGSCKPTVDRYQTVESGGRTYAVTYSASGVISVQLIAGGDLPPSSTISIGSINFNL